MLFCEAATFICSILMVVWDMTSNRGMEGYEDMAVYTLLCSVSTFFAITVTLSLLLVPTHVRSCTTRQMPLTLSNGQKDCSAVSAS
jgi:hypothetical protein